MIILLNSYLMVDVRLILCNGIVVSDVADNFITFLLLVAAKTFHPKRSYSLLFLGLICLTLGKLILGIFCVPLTYSEVINSGCVNTNTTHTPPNGSLPETALTRKDIYTFPV